MINNVKTLKLRKIVNLKDYIKQKNELNKKYESYVQDAIKKGLEDVKSGRVYDIEELYNEIEKEYGW